MVDGETLVLATGLLAQPTSEHISAARGLEKDLHDQATAVLESTSVGRLLVPCVGPRYFTHVSRDYDYASAKKFIEDRVGTEIADEFQLVHQRGRDAVIKRRPEMILHDPLRGVVKLDLDELSETAYAFEVSQVEQMRLVKDWGSGGLLQEWVEMFMTVFPRLYRRLVDRVNDEIPRLAKKSEWDPAPHVVDGYRVLTRQPWDTVIDLRGPVMPPEKGEPPKPNETSEQKKTGFNPENLQTPAQRASK